MPNSHTPEQLARYNETDRIKYWIMRGQTLEQAQKLASAPTGACAICAAKARTPRDRICAPCAETFNRSAIQPEELARFRQYERYRYYIRRGETPEEAARKSNRAATRGTCHRCGKPAYSDRAEICEEHRKVADSERARESAKNAAKKVRNCARCAKPFSGKKGVYCEGCRYGHNAGKTYNTTGKRELRQIALEPGRKAAPPRATPQPAPTITCPPEIKVQRLAPVGLAARSFQDYLHD